MAIKYARLFDPVNQFVRKDGIPNSGGSISVFYEGTDDRAELRDEDGTVLNNPLTLDADGRALGTFVDAARVYRLEVDDAYGAEQFTVRKMVPCGGSAGSALGKEYKVVSTDGTVTVVPYVDAGVVTFDLSTNYGLEGSRWGGKLCLRAEISEADVWEEIQTVSSNGNIGYSDGWYPGHAGAFDLAASVEMAEGVPGALNTVEIMCSLFVGGVQVETQYGIIDPSLPRDRVSFGFKGYALEDEKVDCKFYAKSSAAFSVGLAGRAFYNDEVDGIIGGGGGGNPGYSAGEGIDISTANVISVTGMLPESASSQFAPSGNYAYASSLSGKMDASASSLFQPSGDYAYNSGLSGKLDATASSMFQPSGDYAYNSSLSSKLDATASSMFAPSGDYAYNSSISSFVDSAYVESAVSGKMDASAMTAYQPSGDYAYNSSLSSKLDATASSMFAPSGNYQSALTFGYDGAAISSIDGSSIAGGGGHSYSGVFPVVVDNTAETIALDSTGLSIDSTLSAYQSGDEVVIGVNTGMFAYNSSLSGKLDASAFNVLHDGNLSGSGNADSPLGLASRITFSSESATGQLDDFALTQTYEGATTLIYGGSMEIREGEYGCSINSTGQQMVSGSEASSITGIKLMMHPDTGCTVVPHISLWDNGSAVFITQSAVRSWNEISGKQDVSGMTAYQDVSGMTAYQDVAGMTAYQPSGDYIYASALGIVEV